MSEPNASLPSTMPAPVNHAVDIRDDRPDGHIVISTAGRSFTFSGRRAHVLREAREVCDGNAAAFWLGVATVLSLVSTPKEQPGNGEEQRKV